MQTHAQNQGRCTRLSQSNNPGPLPPSPTLWRPVTHIRSAPSTGEKAFTKDDISALLMLPLSSQTWLLGYWPATLRNIQWYKEWTSSWTAALSARRHPPLTGKCWLTYFSLKQLCILLYSYDICVSQVKFPILAVSCTWPIPMDGNSSAESRR